MSSVLENIKVMRQKAKDTETRYYTSKGGKNMNPSDFKEGKTIIRVAPSHNPEEFPTPFAPFRSTYLKVELGIDELMSWNITKLIKEKSLIKQFGVDKIEELSEWEDDKLKTKLKEILGDGFQYKVNKRVFISTLHGKEGSKDLVEEYIKFIVQQVNSEIGDRDESKKRLNPIFGYKAQGKWHPGINPSTNFVFYGWDWNDKNLYKIEIYPNMMTDIENLYIKFDSGDEPLTVDPFSDIETGIGLLFNKSKNEKGKWVFNIDDVPYTDRSKLYTEFIKSFNITEDQLKGLKEVDSLQKQFGRGAFKASDFKVQLNGLVLFDQEHEYNAFENDDFLKLVEEISDQYSEEEEQEQKDDDAKTGADIDRTFAKKQLGLEKPVEVKQETVPEIEVDEEAELKAKLAAIKKEKAAKAAAAKKKTSAKTPPAKKEEIEEDSFKEETGSTNKGLEDKLAMLRKNLKK